MGKGKLSEEQKELIIKLYATGNYSLRGLGRMFNVSHDTIKVLVSPSYKEYLRQYHKTHWIKNKDKLSKQHKFYYENNKDKVKKIHREYNIKNYEKNKNWQREYDRENRNTFIFVKPEERNLIENYDKALKDDFKNWTIHHRLETHNLDGSLRDIEQTPKQLKEQNLYYNRPAKELIFLLRSEHRRVHNIFLNKRKAGIKC